MVKDLAEAQESRRNKCCSWFMRWIIDQHEREQDEEEKQTIFLLCVY